MKLWWRVSSPIFVITEDGEDLSKIIWDRDLGVHSYSEPMYQFKHAGTEKKLIHSQAKDLNCTIRRGHNGPVIYKRLGNEIWKEGDSTKAVDSKKFRVTPGNYYDVKCTCIIGDTINLVTYNDGSQVAKVI